MSRSNSTSDSSIKKTNHSENIESSPNPISIPLEDSQDKVMTFFNNSSQNTFNTRGDSLASKPSTSKTLPEDIACLRCGQNPQYISRSSKDTSINILGNSVKMDIVILEQIGNLLSNHGLKKENEADYFTKMNIFDQEWEFPFNKRHFEYHNLLQDIDVNPLEVKVNLYKKSLIEMQMQLRNLSDFFMKVDRERIFFRQKLIFILQSKVSELVEKTPEIKQFIEKFVQPDSSSKNYEISRLKKQNKESQSLFVNLKRRNVKLEEEVKQLKKKLKEKRDQLKKYMFRKEGMGEDHNNTRTTTNSNNQGMSMETSNISKDMMRKFPVKNKTLMSNKERPNLKFSSTILTNNPNKKSILNMPNAKNKSHMHINTPKNELYQTNEKEEEFNNDNLQNFFQDSANNFQKAFSNKDRTRRRAERSSIQTESGTIEIPPMLMSLQSQRKSRISGLKVGNPGEGVRRESGFKLLHQMGRSKPQGNLSSKLLNIKKRNSRHGHDQILKNPFTFKKIGTASELKNTTTISNESTDSKKSK